MAIKTGQSVSGFIATDPQLTYGQQGVARLYARMGIEHYRREDDGSFTQLEPSFHNLVVYRKTAERAADLFEKGDPFVADGYVREYAYEKEGQQRGGEEFVAKKIGPDAARSRVSVDRTPQQEAVGQQPVSVDQSRTQNQAFEPPQRPAQQPPQHAAMGQ
ncbi:single-stranded DNA-binding protein [Nesterenkonia alkaliphila]|uniref:Single-stranded DNA-binding protein n=1 Tax=Nesterenkonia alkaliphila TaxID=1463631 RepID=A0A7K1ULR7_9MICC|nr:single-stranded DNA-binding protein [Nesterenkonia alkaliphila]MVT27428.1 single-stranded DNA-binding protein [Nesterenkonia alkaliphila]GFZ89889.1 hypothetical protein GCM10011359_18980 [Nesterenkonia alkaliphila]